jgi:nitrate reductase delta subunit
MNPPRYPTLAMTTTLTSSQPAALSALGCLLAYPGPDFEDLLTQSGDAIDSLPLLAFCNAVSRLTADEREELYTATFDVTPRCVPYVSIHLFGEENFKRGEFMAALHNQYEQVGFVTGGELPDHLAILLRYAATLSEPARRELVEFCLLGPVGKIMDSLPDEHPYRYLLETVDESLRAPYPGIEPPLSPLEQMRQHGICPTVSDGCNCGPIVDGPLDDGARTLVRHEAQEDPMRTEVRAPFFPPLAPL